MCGRWKTGVVAVCIGLALPCFAESLIFAPRPGETVKFVDYGLGLYENDYELEGELVVEVTDDFARSVPVGLEIRPSGSEPKAVVWLGSVGDHLFGSRDENGTIFLEGVTAAGITEFVLDPVIGVEALYHFTGQIAAVPGNPSSFWTWDVELELVSVTDSTILPGGRFAVQATWEAPGGDTGVATGRALGPDSVNLWFFSPSNPELTIKVLDACEQFDRFWVFGAGLTNLGVELTVVDRWRGVSRTYKSAVGEPFMPVQDTSTFDTCAESP